MTDSDRDNLQMAYNAVCSAMGSLTKVSDEYQATVDYTTARLEQAREHLGLVAFDRAGDSRD